MSLVAFKKKSVIQYGSKRSAKPPGGFWLPQGPFGAGTKVLQDAINYPGPVGFSLNGTHRNIGGVGRESKFSKSGTPFRGVHAIGWGGLLGRYNRSEPVYNVNEVIALGDQWLFVKPTVLTTKGMLEKKYKWINNGQYPNYWVQPVQDGTTQSDTKSQGMYIHDLTTSNICVTDINNTEKYITNYKRIGPTLCYTSTARFKFNDMARNGPYTKELYQPETSSQRTLRIQRRCTDPFPFQKPFPYAVQTGSDYKASGTSITSFGSGCGTSNIQLTPPNWYLESASAGGNIISRTTTSQPAQSPIPVSQLK